MKISLLFLATITLFSLSLASVVPSHPTQPSDNCEVPSLIAYCLDVMKMGSFYDSADAGTPSLQELQNDVADIPMGSCSWADFPEKITAEDCIKALEDYAASEDDEEEIEKTDRFLKKIKKAAKKVKKAIKKGAKKVKKAVKKGAKKVGKGLKKVGKGLEKVGKEIERGAKKIGKFCSKNKELCKKAAEIGKQIINGEHPNPGPTPPYNPNFPQFPNHHGPFPYPNGQFPQY